MYMIKKNKRLRHVHPWIAFCNLLPYPPPRGGGGGHTSSIFWNCMLIYFILIWVHKVDLPNSIVCMNWTPRFKWYKKGAPKTHKKAPKMCWKRDWTTCSKHSIIKQSWAISNIWGSCGRPLVSSDMSPLTLKRETNQPFMLCERGTLHLDHSLATPNQVYIPRLWKKNCCLASCWRWSSWLYWVGVGGGGWYPCLAKGCTLLSYMLVWALVVWVLQLQVVLFVSMRYVFRFSEVDLPSLFILVDELIGLVWAPSYRIPLGVFGCVFR